MFQNIMSLHELITGKKIMDFPVELGTITGMTGEREHTEMFYGFYSFLTPNKIYRVDFTKAEIEISVGYKFTLCKEICKFLSSGVS